ncbi:unnamed protein product, partial [Larinioides sclopetarius]
FCSCDFLFVKRRIHTNKIQKTRDVKSLFHSPVWWFGNKILTTPFSFLEIRRNFKAYLSNFLLKDEKSGRNSCAREDVVNATDECRFL